MLIYDIYTYPNTSRSKQPAPATHKTVRTRATQEKAGRGETEDEAVRRNRAFRCQSERRAMTHSTNRRCVASFVYPLANSAAAVIVVWDKSRDRQGRIRRHGGKARGVKREAGKSDARANDKPFSVYFCSLPVDV